MKEEFTTTMHEEMLGDEVSHEDIMVMDVYGAIKQGIPKDQALKEAGISERFYGNNIRRVLHSI